MTSSRSSRPVMLRTRRAPDSRPIRPGSGDRRRPDRQFEGHRAGYRKFRAIVLPGHAADPHRSPWRTNFGSAHPKTAPWGRNRPRGCCGRCSIPVSFMSGRSNRAKIWSADSGSGARSTATIPGRRETRSRRQARLWFRRLRRHPDHDRKSVRKGDLTRPPERRRSHDSLRELSLFRLSQLL